MSIAPLTTTGARRLREELDQLRSVKRPAVIAAIADSFSIRREALQHRLTYSTTIPGARALIQAIDSRNHPRVWSLQELHEELRA